MKENKSVGPNLKSYFYYTNELADSGKDQIKGIIIIASGIEGTGALYDEIGDYLDTKGYAMYAIDEWQYGKTGEVSKSVFKNWGRKDFYYAAYNLHALSTLAKRAHPNVPVCLIGNDFGAMLTLRMVKEFPESVDKVITIGWGMPRAQDYGFLFTSYIKKLFLYDNGVSNISHFNKSKRLYLRFEKNERYAWLSSDLDQVKKIKDAGYIKRPGTVGHYYRYYAAKIKTPLFMSLRKSNKELPMLFLSGNKDLLTMHGWKTKQLEAFYKMKNFKNVASLIMPGRHELLFEKKKFKNVDLMLEWMETGKISQEIRAKEEALINSEVQVVGENKPVEINEEPLLTYSEVKVQKEMENPVNNFELLQEADDDLLIRTNRMSN